MPGLSRVALRLEPLSERTLPSVTVVQAGGTLTITGTQRADTIEIEDDGTASGLTVNGEAVPAGGPITAVVVKARGGSDVVSYDLTGDFVGTARSVKVWLGNGHDTFTANLGHGIDAASSFELAVWGANGKDTLDVTGAGGLVAGTLDVQLFGGNGIDAISFTYAAEVDGTLNVLAHGGNGTDTVHADVTVAADSAGSVTAEVLGKNGKDDLGLSVTGDGLTGLTAVDLSIDGGHGKDSVTSSDNVTVVDAARNK